MKTNSKVKNKGKVAGTISAKQAVAQSAATGKVNFQPDYSSMAREIEKIKDPVPFAEIKAFYNVK